MPTLERFSFTKQLHYIRFFFLLSVFIGDRLARRQTRRIVTKQLFIQIFDDLCMSIPGWLLFLTERIKVSFKNSRNVMAATVRSGDMDARAHRNQGSGVVCLSSSSVVSTFSQIRSLGTWVVVEQRHPGNLKIQHQSSRKWCDISSKLQVKAVNCWHLPFALIKLKTD